MTIAIKPTASGATIEQNGSTILTVDGSGNITPSNNLYPKVPTFSASFVTDQNISQSVWTKVQYTSEDWDTSSDYDNTTNYRFTPSVAGYYQVNASVKFNYSGAAGDANYLAIYKNGVAWNISSVINVTSVYGTLAVSGIVYCNGSSDYIEIYGITNHNSPSFDQTSGQDSRFSAALVSV